MYMHGQVHMSRPMPSRLLWLIKMKNKELNIEGEAKEKELKRMRRGQERRTGRKNMVVIRMYVMYIQVMTIVLCIAIHTELGGGVEKEAYLINYW